MGREPEFPRMKWKALATALAIALTGCVTASQPAVEAPAAQAALTVPHLAYTMRTLPNGLRVYAMHDANTANVSVQVWYNVGSKDDPVGRSGFAHLFEHIMFKATRDLPSESFDRLTEDVGGFNNASTYDDFTNYYEVVPAHYLEPVLWAEAERMGSLVVDQATFSSERDVVKEELRQRILAQPYGRLFGLYIAQTNFDVHPYGRPGIGSIEELDAATVDDVRAFHAQYYRPDNAILVVSGNFDPAQLDQWVDRYFTPIAKPARAIPRVSVVEPRRTAPRAYTVYEPNTPLPAVVVTYQGPDARNADLPAIMVMDAILTKGESSRLYQAMVYDQQVASEVFSSFEPTQNPSGYSLGAILSEGKSADDGLRSLNAEIARVRDGPVTAAELDEAKNEIVTENIESRETAFGRASELANSVIRFGDPDYADTLLARIQAVTAADVQRVARAWLDDRTSVTIRYLSDETLAQGQHGDTIATSSHIQAQTLSVPASEIPTYALAPPEARQQPPAPGAPVTAQLPSPAERTLPNGLRVIVASERNLPLVSADLRILSGGGSDPQGHAGLASLTAALVTKGTAAHSATDIARAIESLGATLDTSAGADSSTVSLETRSDRVNEAFAIMADVARNPTFASDELDRERQQELDGLSVSLRQPGQIARFVMSRALFGASPYGGVATPASLGAITQADAIGFHHAYWRPDNAVLVITGDVTPEEGFALAQRHFGDWARPATALPAEPDASAAANARRTIVVDLPNSGQAAVAYGMRGVARTDADYFPTLIANTVLGGGYSARLNMEIRIRRGLSYGASSGFSPRLAAGPIVASAQTRNDAAVQVVNLMRTELGRMGTEAVSDSELNARRSSLIGGFGRDVETTSGLASQLSQLALFNVPLDRLQTYVADVSAVTPAQVRAVGARLFNPANADLVVVGDARVFYDALHREARDAERIPIDRLNLDGASLH